MRTFTITPADLLATARVLVAQGPDTDDYNQALVDLVGHLLGLPVDNEPAWFSLQSELRLISLRWCDRPRTDAVATRSGDFH